MKRSRLTEDQIIGILKEHEAGVSVADLCRKHGMNRPRFTGGYIPPAEAEQAFYANLNTLDMVA